MNHMPAITGQKRVSVGTRSVKPPGSALISKAAPPAVAASTHVACGTSISRSSSSTASVSAWARCRAHKMAVHVDSDPESDTITG